MNQPDRQMNPMQREHAPLTTNMIRYAWKELAKRAGVKDFTPDTYFDGTPVAYGDPIEIAFEKPGIIIQASSPAAFPMILNAAKNSLNWVPVSDLMPTGMPTTEIPLSSGQKIPILFWGGSQSDEQQRCVTCRDDGTIILHFDMIAATILMLTRWEELVAPETRDLHSRFPATESIAYKQGFLERPLIDEYALILQAWIRQINPQWQPKPSTFSIHLSHDIDWVTHFASPKHGFKQAIGDVVKRRNFKQALATQKLLWGDLLNPNEVAPLCDIHMLAAHSQEVGLKSAFYFKASKYSPMDSGYNPASRVVKRSIEALVKAGHEIGFHPGYYTLNNLAELTREKNALDEAVADILEEPIKGGRQHYLRFNAPITWRHWAEIGMVYDSTLGYPEFGGFRCGTCHPFQVFDYENDVELPLVELPLIVMDATLRYQQKLSAEQAQDYIIQMARKCRAVKGTFTLLWHNTSLSKTWSQWGKQYPQILQDLASLK